MRSRHIKTSFEPDFSEEFTYSHRSANNEDPFEVNNRILTKNTKIIVYLSNILEKVIFLLFLI